MGQDFIECINLHKSDLNSPRNIGLMEFQKLIGNKDFNPAGVLKDYIYLEANSFFKYAKKAKANGDKNIPNLPEYLEDLENFRDVMVGHRDAKEKVLFPEEWIELQEKTTNLIPIKKLIQDINTCYGLIMERHEALVKEKI